MHYSCRIMLYIILYIGFIILSAWFCNKYNIDCCFYDDDYDL